MTRISQSNAEYFRQSALIPSGENVSTAVEIAMAGPRGFGVMVPSGYPGGDIGLQVSQDGSAWLNVRDSYNSAVAVSGLANLEMGQVMPLPPAAWVGGVYNYARFVSYSAGTLGLSAQGTALPLTMLLLS